MNNLNVNDVIYREKPNKILIYLRDKKLFYEETHMLKYYGYIQKMEVYSYEYIDKENKTILIRVLESEV